MAEGFTPGPWETFRTANAGNIGVRATVGHAQAFRVAYVPVLPMDDLPAEAEANARLIAAAPELYASVRDLLSELDEMSCEDEEPNEACSLCRARALLARVQGEG